MTRGGAVVACRAHNPKVAGSSPAPATKLLFRDLSHFKLQSVPIGTILTFRNAPSHQNNNLVVNRWFRGKRSQVRLFEERGIALPVAEGAMVN